MLDIPGMSGVLNFPPPGNKPSAQGVSFTAMAQRCGATDGGDRRTDLKEIIQ
jgi:hypothetical protein